MECPKNAEKNGTDCVCVEGYLAVKAIDSPTPLSRKVQGNDYCKLAFFSPLITHKVENEVSIVSIRFQGTIDDDDLWKDRIKIEQFSEDSNNPESITLTIDENLQIETEKELILGENVDRTIVSFYGLRPGKRYLAKLKPKQATDAGAGAGEVQFPIVPSCSCQALTSKDHTGRPTDLKIFQDRGHVQFSFNDKVSFGRIVRVGEVQKPDLHSSD